MVKDEFYGYIVKEISTFAVCLLILVAALSLVIIGIIAALLIMHAAKCDLSALPNPFLYVFDE